MSVELIAKFRNEADGLEALVMDGNSTHNYRVIFRDTDADATVFVRFTHTYLDCMKAVEEFLMGDFMRVEENPA